MKCHWAMQVSVFSYGKKIVMTSSKIGIMFTMERRQAHLTKFLNVVCDCINQVKQLQLDKFYKPERKHLEESLTQSKGCAPIRIRSSTIESTESLLVLASAMLRSIQGLKLGKGRIIELYFS
jgi:hypothetical protein